MAARMVSLKEMRAAYEAHIDRAKREGMRIHAFEAPCCGKQIETLAAPRNAQWDTMTVCPHCGTHFMKIATFTGAVGRMPPGARLARIREFNSGARS